MCNFSQPLNYRARNNIFMSSTLLKSLQIVPLFCISHVIFNFLVFFKILNIYFYGNAIYELDKLKIALISFNAYVLSESKIMPKLD